MKIKEMKTQFKYFIFKHKYSKNDKEKICSKCHLEPFDIKLVCKTCVGLRKTYNLLKDVNYFTLFDINNNYDINKKNLDNQFRNLQKEYHPDKFHNAEEDILNESKNCSSLINKAYQTLKNDYERANYLVIFPIYHIS